MRNVFARYAATSSQTRGRSSDIASAVPGCRRISLPNFIRLAVMSCFVVCVTQSQSVAQVEDFSFKPLIIPYKIVWDVRGNIQVRFSNSIATPIGTFSTGTRALTVEATNTYVIIKYDGIEKLYCIGRRGKLRLHAEGVHDIELSNLQGYVNVIVIGICTKTGSVGFDFVPDESNSDIARVRNGTVDLVLRKNGQLVFDGITGDEIHSRSEVKKTVFADIPENTRMIVSIVTFGNGTPRSSEMICDDQQRVEALWLRECMYMLQYCEIDDLTGVNAYNNNNVVMFEDRSIVFRHILAATEFQVHKKDVFMGADY